MSKYNIERSECGEGWYPIIQPLIDLAESKNLKILQIKEKFGGLRFYYEGVDEEMSEAISKAAAIADVTCELCGKPATERFGGWIRVLCDEHAIERAHRNKR